VNDALGVVDHLQVLVVLLGAAGGNDRAHDAALIHTFAKLPSSHLPEEYRNFVHGGLTRL